MASQGFTVTKMSEVVVTEKKASAKAKKRPKPLFGTGVKSENVTIFSRQLATLLKAGLPLLRSLEVIARQEKNPCALCAKLRRGALHTAAQELGCNKVALGHHLDDAIETFYMNLWREGRIGCFSPVTYLSRRDLTLIRPMLLATEAEVTAAIREEGLPIVKSRCPADGATAREETKEFVRERCRTDRAFRQKTLHALQESGIDGWRPLHTGRGSFVIK